MNWAWQPDHHANFAWISNGLKSIQDATTDAQAAAAAQEWMGKIQLDRVTLQGAIKLLLEQDVDQAVLGNAQCASDKAKEYVVTMYLALGKSRIVPDQAPANGVNTGVSSGQVTSSTTNEIRETGRLSESTSSTRPARSSVPCG
ncbi:hypothetical protein IPL68_00615 [Candidatus Saccharibacteria bacterium]|nr:MAG: hypothetical protein IPL68_00615 [Candidatus Saccharibacteria bacterium]